MRASPIFFFPCILSLVVSQECKCVAVPPHASPSPTPVPTPPPRPSLVPGLIINFLDHRVASVVPVIQAFKLTITLDPKGITQTWTGPNVCAYVGFYCDNPPDNESATAVAGVVFNGFGLAAPSLLGFLDKLPDLAIFHANSNLFAGLLPATLASLPYLYELDLSNNQLTGAFPPAILITTPNLNFLDLRYNLFTGTIPAAAFSALPELEELFLNNNLFALSLPGDLGSTPASYLTLANNKLTGSIPPTIGNLADTLIEVLLANNLLTGCVPYQVGLLKRATVFDASGNKLTGALPRSLACMATVEVLSFADNLFYGAVPEEACAELGRRSSFAEFSLASNYLTSVGAQCVGLIARGVLDVSNNCIPGQPNQRSATDCLLFSLLPRLCSPSNTLPCSVHSSATDGPDPDASRRGALEEARGRRRRRFVTYSALRRNRRLG